MTEEIKLLETMDAMVWAKDFLLRNPNTGLDESTMLAWFANAIMTGYDHHRWQDEKKERLSALKSPEVVAMREKLVAVVNTLRNASQENPEVKNWLCPSIEAYDRLVERLETDLNKKEG